ncbi:MAG: hypothetical protein DWQ06_03710 [Calditrichaeota bacterium]|nr:MAG: hypothetical protein DWQ06_03710 [Calditrichota bacterium]
MNNKFTLETGSKKFLCPQCQQKRFKRYIDVETKEYLNVNVGICDRINNCGYHLPPREFFSSQESNINSILGVKKQAQQEPPKEPSFIPFELVQKSMSCYETNNFAQYLKSCFSEETTKRLLNLFFIGTSKHWKGATIFWQVDQNGKVRSGKVMLYDSKTGKRRREFITWVHKLGKFKNFNLAQCLFGEYQLSQTQERKTIAIVESEKTAVLMSLVMPKYIWLACGGLHNLNSQICKALKGRKVIIYPDVSGFEQWKMKAQRLMNFCEVRISDTLESLASKETVGLDLADFLERDKNYNWILAPDGSPAFWNELELINHNI